MEIFCLDVWEVVSLEELTELNRNRKNIQKFNLSSTFGETCSNPETKMMNI